jgi:hypothetical protein
MPIVLVYNSSEAAKFSHIVQFRKWEMDLPGLWTFLYEII